MRRLRRKQEKRLKGLNSIIKSSLVVGLTLTLASQTYAQAVPMSNNLPVPNYVNGASLKYNSGLNVSSSVASMSIAAQEQAAKAADSSNNLNINVQAAAADLKYNSFNVGQNSKVQFNFSNKNQVALNRITSVGEAYASRIAGNISQTGQGGAVLLINPNGILFSRDSSVNLNSFMGSTLKYKSSDLNKKTITLAKSEQEPRGIQMHWGSIIKTDKGAVFASNGIYNDGTDIFAQSGNVQLITGDGVTFTYNEALKPNIVSQEDVQASTVKPEDVKYQKYQPYGHTGFTGSESSIYTEKAKISGENLNFVSKLSLSSNASLKAIINLDGIIEAKKGKPNESGNVTVYSSHASNINTNIKADKNIKIDTKKFTTNKITSGNNIKIIGGITAKEINSGGNIEISGGVLDVDNISAQNDITFKGGYVLCKQLKAGGNVDFWTTSSIEVLEGEAKGNIKFYGERKYSRIGKLKASGDIDIYSFYSVYAKDLHAGGTLDALSTFGSILLGNIYANKKISLGTSEGITTTKNIICNDDVSIGAVGYVHTGNVKAQGSISIGSYRRELTIGDINAGENILVRGANLKVLGNLKAKEKIYVFTGVANLQNIEAGGDILIDARSLYTDSPDNFIKTTGYYSNILINSTCRPGFIPSIELSHGTLIFEPGSYTSDVYNSLKTESEIPKIAIANLYDKSIYITKKDQFLGRIENGQAKPIHLILSTKDKIDFEFTSAHPDSTLTVDHCWLKPELIDVYGRIDIRKPLTIQGYGTNDINNEANIVKVIDATKDPDFNTFDQNFFSNNLVELIKL